MSKFWAFSYTGTPERSGIPFRWFLWSLTCTFLAQRAISRFQKLGMTPRERRHPPTGELVRSFRGKAPGVIFHFSLPTIWPPSICPPARPPGRRPASHSPSKTKKSSWTSAGVAPFVPPVFLFFCFFFLFSFIFLFFPCKR